MYKKQREGDKVRHLLAIILMIKKQNAEIVAELMEMDADTIRRWVEAFNEGGLEELYKKKAPEDDPESP
jgi:transposase